MTALFKILMMMMMMIIIIIIKGKIGRVPKEKMEKQSNAWAVH
jgi:hypothetical protein